MRIILLQLDTISIFLYAVSVGTYEIAFSDVIIVSAVETPSFNTD